VIDLLRSDPFVRDVAVTSRGRSDGGGTRALAAPARGYFSNLAGLLARGIVLYEHSERRSGIGSFATVLGRSIERGYGANWPAAKARN